MAPLPLSPTSLLQPAPKLSSEQLKLSTAQLYSDPDPPSLAKLVDPSTHSGPWAFARAKLDYTYHKFPSKERQALQDEIVAKVLAEKHNDFSTCDSRTEGWDAGPSLNKGDKIDTRTKPIALFTSGGMGAGKGHVLRMLLKDGTIRLAEDFILIDPDKLALLLPERSQYLSADSTTTSTLLHPEASFLQEILSTVARSLHRSVVVDGSLSCSEWFEHVMQEFGKENYGVEILFVFAEEETMRERARKREKATGRRVTDEQIHRSRLNSPKSVRVLSKVANIHRLRIVDNTTDTEPPRIVYDSKDDPDWAKGMKEVDVESYAFGKREGGKL